MLHVSDYHAILIGPLDKTTRIHDKDSVDVVFIDAAGTYDGE